MTIAEKEQEILEVFERLAAQMGGSKSTLPPKPQTRWQKIRDRLKRIRALLFAPLCLLVPLSSPVQSEREQLLFAFFGEPVHFSNQFLEQQVNQLESHFASGRSFHNHFRFTHTSPFARAFSFPACGSSTPFNPEVNL